MTSRPNVTAILKNLKSFQRDTVAYVFRRLYQDTPPAHRFLIADEVGLGKTLVARGLIAKVIDHLWPTGKQITIVYICSNAQIAEQNLARLRIEGLNYAYATRPTLLPFEIQSMRQDRVNLISFTPQTAFHPKQGTGVIRERALLVRLLMDAWSGCVRSKVLGVLCASAKPSNFAYEVNRLKPFDTTLTTPFVAQLRDRDDLRQRFEALCESVDDDSGLLPASMNQERRRFIGELRAMLAHTCLTNIQPTLVLLDEFQRFKEILVVPDVDDEDEDAAPSLATQFFSNASAGMDSRVVLISATPYKMYTLDHESEAHYEDMLQTLDFLNGGRMPEIEELISQYRVALYQINSEGGLDKAVAVKQALERQLRQCMVRTERLTATADRNGMLKNAIEHAPTLSKEDIEAYLALHSIAKEADHADPMEYWKSIPYPLNFMGRDEYLLKRAFKRAIDEKNVVVQKALAASGNLLLPCQTLQDYEPVDPANARLRQMIDDLLDTGVWRMLWVPPSLRYYHHNPDAHSPYAGKPLQSFTKRLMFSAWQVVPRSVASLLSYEVERRIVAALPTSYKNTAADRARRGKLLRIGLNQKRQPGSMTLLCLLYPCATLAHRFDPLDFARRHFREKQSERLSLESLRRYIEQEIQKLLDELSKQLLPSPQDGLEDERWYWIAPLLLDMKYHKEETSAWFDEPKLAAIWSNLGLKTDEDGEEASQHWEAHVALARDVIRGRGPRLGRRPNDLARALSDMALGGPGVVALRTLWRIAASLHTDGNVNVPRDDPILRDCAAQIAWSFRSLFSRPESTDIIRGLHGEEPFWRRVLEYCVDGHLQAVIDEYGHLLNDTLPIQNRDSLIHIQQVATQIGRTASLRTTSTQIDDIPSEPQAQSIFNHQSLRTHFAVRYGDSQVGEEISADDRVLRTTQVRDAFNSPFWPFVLVTTSVGQEGLDFHPYCHAVVHWNLPSNPVDLEQREGRVHRYKGHAVRKNVASRYGFASIARQGKKGGVTIDPWRTLFSAGEADETLPHEIRDLAPYWVCPGKAYIQRYVPRLPLSRDDGRRTMLLRSLALYRLVFGQARQEDLVNHLANRLDDLQIQRLYNEIGIQLGPPREDSEQPSIAQTNHIHHASALTISRVTDTVISS